MFTLLQIKEAHAKVRSGADFPQYIRDLIGLGVLKYTIYVNDGHAEYEGIDNYSVFSKAEYPILHIADSIGIDKFKHDLKEHQQGKTDYSRFCKDSADAGVEKWIIDMHAKTCTYYGRLDKFILEEKIPV